MKKHIVQLIIVSLLTVLAWRKILFQSFMGEGFYHFSHGAKEAGFPDIFLRYDTGAMLIFDLLKPTFKDSFFFYQVLALTTLVILSILFYLLVYELTSRRLLSFFCAVFFSVNFTGLFEMFAVGNYQFFAQRAIYLLLLFPSLILFVRYINTRRESCFILSLFLYTLSFMLAKFSTFFLPIFIAYFLAVFLINLKNKYGLWYWVHLGVRVGIYPVVAFSILYAEILYGSGSLIKGQSFFTFLGSEKETLGQQLVHQFTVLFIPDGIIQFLQEIFHFPSTMASLYIPTLIFFVLLAVYLFFKEKTLRVIILAITLFIPIVFILNSFTRGTDFIGHIESGSRYLFIPSIGSTILWAIFFYSLFRRRRVSVTLALKVFVIFLVVLFIYSNINSIWTKIDKDFYKHVASKNSLQYIKRLSSSFSLDSFIVVPTNLGFHGSEFSQVFYGKSNTTFAPFNSDWHKMLKRPFDPKKDFILLYDYENDTVVNKTNEYQKIIEKKKQEVR